MSLNKQVWISQILKNFYSVGLFLNYVTDYSAFVNYNTLHLPSTGADPNVLKNNTTYPVAVVARVDVDNEISLDTYDTENTVVRNIEKLEYSYDLVEATNQVHKSTLQNHVGRVSAHAISPNANATNTPVILTTGEAVGGKKRLVPADILKLKKLFDNLKVPTQDRYLVLCPEHLEDLITFDLKGFRDITDIENGVVKKFAGFGILEFNDNARYNPSTLTKQALGSASGNISSFAFQKNEVMKADGQLQMFAKLDDPEQRGDIIGYQKRFVCLPIRGKGIGAIVTDNA